VKRQCAGRLRLKNKLLVFQYRHCAALLAFLTVAALSVHASNHYTDHQLDALATRVGRTYWIVAVKNQTPAFLSSPTANAAPFHPQAKESFEITELVGRKDKNPYYKVKFDSGKEAFIRPETFVEELNVSLASVDPQAIEKKKGAEDAEEEKKRIEWIQAQPWPRNVKEAAINRQVIGGMNGGEVKKILGNPIRVRKMKAQLNVAEEHWLYADGSTAVFYNGLLNRIEPKRSNEPQPRAEEK
jgi:hypothetical protein